MGLVLVSTRCQVYEAFSNDTGSYDVLTLCYNIAAPLAYSTLQGTLSRQACVLCCPHMYSVDVVLSSQVWSSSFGNEGSLQPSFAVSVPFKVATHWKIASILLSMKSCYDHTNFDHTIFVKRVQYNRQMLPSTADATLYAGQIRKGNNWENGTICCGHDLLFPWPRLAFDLARICICNCA
jgi:hypothetical protein